MSKRKLKVNFQKIFSVFVSLVLSFSLLTLNCFAFDFNGSSRTVQDAYSDWLSAMRSYANGTLSDDEFNDACDRFAVDIAYTGIFFPDELYANFVNQYMDFVSGGKVNPQMDSLFFDLFEALGLPNFKKEFEKWYQDTYGNEYGKQEDSGIDWTCGQYVLCYHSTDGCWRYRMFIIYSGSSIPVYHQASSNSDYFRGASMGRFDYRIYTSYFTSDHNWTDWVDGGWYYNTSTSASFVISGSGGGVSNATIVDYTNLPLNYNGEELPEFGDSSLVGDGGGDGSGGLTPEQFQEFIDYLLEALEASKPDLSSIEGILTAIYNKCCEISNKIKSSDNFQVVLAPINLFFDNCLDFFSVISAKVTDVFSSLNSIFEKLTEFFNKFIETFENFFERLGEFFQSIFVPSDDYISSTILDIKAEFDEAFSFAGDIRLICDTAVNSYKNGSSSAPDISVDVDGFGSHYLDFSFFDKNMPLIRSILCAFIYCTFAFNLYRRIPCYISGGGER